jgi:hypothetical protein
MSHVGVFLDGVVKVVRTAVRSFLLTCAAMVGAGVLAGAGSAWLAADGSTTRAVVAGVLALVLFVSVGVVLAAKRAVAAAVVEGVGQLKLATTLVALLFDHVLGVREGTAHGERGGAVAQTVERVPLAKAEEALGSAAQGVLGAAPGSRGLVGWLKGLVVRRVLGLVGDLTLARFRAENAATGGVDLLKVRDELGRVADGTIAARVAGTVRGVTTLLVLAASLGALALALLVRLLPL